MGPNQCTAGMTCTDREAMPRQTFQPRISHRISLAPRRQQLEVEVADIRPQARSYRETSESEKPPKKETLRGPLGSPGLGTSANPTMLLDISLPDCVRYVAAMRHSPDFISARKARADNSRRFQSARRASSMARALRACTSAISSSISVPFIVRLMRNTVDNAITTSP